MLWTSVTYTVFVGNETLEDVTKGLNSVTEKKSGVRVQFFNRPQPTRIEEAPKPLVTRGYSDLGRSTTLLHYERT